jgi:hypothetical protein
MTAEQIVAKIREAWAAYRRCRLEAEFDAEEMDADSRLKRLVHTPPPPFGGGNRPEAPPVPPAPKPKAAEKPTYHKFPGRFVYESDGERWRARYDSLFIAMGPLSPGKFPPDRWVSGYDGTIHYHLVAGAAYLCEAHWAAESVTPRSLFWDGAERGVLINSLLTPNATVTQCEIGDYRCYVVEPPRDRREERSFEIVISPHQSFLPVRVIAFERGEAKHTFRLHDIKESADGIWAPGRITVENRSVGGGLDGPSALEDRRETRVVRFAPHPTFDPGAFALEIPASADVLDRRTGLFHINDPWWPELSQFLREKYDWPKADLTPLKELRSPPNSGLDGRSPPPLQASRWLKGTPLDWEKLRGKVVLLVFPRPDDINLVPALRRLAETYKPAGLEVVEVFHGYPDPEATSRRVEELQIAHPVLLDAPRPGDLGVTCRAYGLWPHDLPAAFVIDAGGTLRSFGEGRVIEHLIHWLKEAGAKGVTPPPADSSLAWIGRATAIRRAWDDWTRTAPAAAQLAGVVRDGRGRPVPAAAVRATVSTSVLRAWKSSLQFEGRSAAATTDADGHFVIPGLCKGTYLIEVSAPGKATVQRRAVIRRGGAGEAVRREIVLGQSDVVAGRVHDEARQSIPRARAALSRRSFPGEDDDHFETIGLAKQAVADENGRFRFQGVLGGSYTLTVTAEGYQAETRTEVPAGSEELDVTLKRVSPRR